MTRAILLLAAGASSRMRGRDKLLEEVDGQSLLRVMAVRALRVCGSVYVALPKGNQSRLAALDGLNLSFEFVENPEDGLSTSIKAGAKAAQGKALMILPADMPDLSTDDLITVWDCFEKHGGNSIVKATDPSGIKGHPTVFPSTCTPMLQDLTGDRGAANLIREHGFIPCVLPDSHATTDLDTPEDWQNWRNRQ